MESLDSSHVYWLAEEIDVDTRLDFRFSDDRLPIQKFWCAHTKVTARRSTEWDV